MNSETTSLITTVFSACAQLSALTGRPVIPDGHLVGTIGEVLAAELLDLKLMSPSNRGYDAIDTQGRKVEIKCTTGRSIALSSGGTEAERLVVITLDPLGNGHIVYDGPAAAAWGLAGPAQKNGQRSLSLTRLMKARLGDAPSAVRPTGN